MFRSKGTNYQAKSHSVHSLEVPGLCFHIWPDDGSFEPKHVALFLILVTIYRVIEKDGRDLKPL